MQVKKQAIIDPIVRRSTRKEREAKLARRKRARKNLVRHVDIARVVCAACSPLATTTGL